MKIKQRVGDFQVREQLAEGVLQASGPHRVYRVTKRKLTSREAARVLAEEAGVEQGQIAMCGWKDRQGITVQHMSVPRGRDVRMDSTELKIDSVGFAQAALDSDNSRGNAFEIRIRDLGPYELGTLRESLDVVRQSGVANYFDDQRFGNLKHNQGWIARDLMQGEHERALKSILAAPSPHDDERRGHFKARMRDAWGDWVQCLEVARRFREHHSIFEHLQRAPTDFAGAFEFVASRLRLIHLFAYQSHIWNRAVAARVGSTLDVSQRVVMYSEEGKLLSWAGREPIWAERRDVFRLPGPGLEDVTDPDEYAAFRDVLAAEGLVADRFRIDGVPGFQLKGEDRPLILRPAHMRVRPRERDTENHDRWSVVVRFELPRGAYATLVVKRLFASSTAARPPRFEGGRREGGAKPWGGGGGGRGAGGGRGGGRGGGARGSGRSSGGGSSRSAGGGWSGGDARGGPGRSSRDAARSGAQRRARGGGRGAPYRSDSSGAGSGGGGWAPRRPDTRNDQRGGGQSWRGHDSRGHDSRGRDSRGYDSRGYDSRGQGGRGQDSRGSWRGQDARGQEQHSRGQEPRERDSRGSNFRGPGSRGDGYRGQSGRVPGPDDRPRSDRDRHDRDRHDRDRHDRDRHDRDRQDRDRDRDRGGARPRDDRRPDRGPRNPHDERGR
ncbi:MAG: tRNA pseudouridine(13) synthase TruD [Planctomycetota bacterium]